MLAKELDQFYTNPKVADNCLQLLSQHIDINSFDNILEPSAGLGSFYNLLNKDKRIGLDLEPKSKGIIKQDYFNYMHTLLESYIVIGNPPFGKNASLAVKFFNYSKFADYICFIVPKTFRKVSIQNRLNLQFKLLHDYDIEDNAFIYEDKAYNVPCCFQIWKKQKVKRKKVSITTKHKDFNFVNNLKDADFIVQRVGGAAGKVKTENLEKYSIQSHYYIKSNINVKQLLHKFKSLDFRAVKYNTAGNPSISKNELIEIYTK